MGPRFLALALFLAGPVLGDSVLAADPNACAIDVLTIRIDPRDSRTLYAGAFVDGLLRSTDAGATWTPLVGVPSESVSALLFDPTDAMSIYGATYWDYLFKSSDGGVTWARKKRGLVPPPCGPFPCVNTPEFHVLAADPGAPSTVYAAAAGLYRSRDGGWSWDKVEFSASGEQWLVGAVLLVPPPNSAIYVAANVLPDRNAIFKSADHGATWSASAEAPPKQVLSLAADPSNPAVLLAGTIQGMFKSTDRGEHWRSSSAGLPIRQPYLFPVRGLTADSNAPGTLYASADVYHLFKSTDHGETWTPSQQGLEAEIVNATTIDPTDSSMVYAATGRGVFRSSDGGASWQPRFDLGTTPIIFGTELVSAYSSLDGSTGNFLQIIGKGFDTYSVISWDGSPRRTFLVSCTRLWAEILSQDIAEPGTFWLTVTNSDGTRSEPFPFVIEPKLPARSVLPVREQRAPRPVDRR